MHAIRVLRGIWSLGAILLCAALSGCGAQRGDAAGIAVDGGAQSPPAEDGGAAPDAGSVQTEDGGLAAADGGEAVDGGGAAEDGGEAADGRSPADGGGHHRDGGAANDGGHAADGGAAGGGSPDAGPPTQSGRAIPSPLYGVTVDDVSGLSSIVESVRRLAHTPIVRIVFDEVPATDYTTAAAAIHDVAYVMGEILDSFYVHDYTAEQYAQRTTEYLTTLGDSVDLWEVGNEINGEWLGATPTVVTMMTSAYDLVKAQGKKTALTLYYNQDCWENPQNEMFTWTEANVPDRMKQGLDYVLVSYYEDDCNGLEPDWPPIFDRLAALFPNSKVGFGEVGTKFADRKASYVTRYYGLQIPQPRYVGGYFWWYFREDMVPYTSSLWSVLNTAISAGPTPTY
jgi:hypothetical protein